MNDLVTCNHLHAIEQAIRADGVAVVTAQDWWGGNHPQRIYFNCVLEREKIEKRFVISSIVKWYEWDGRVGGHEAGFECSECGSMLSGGYAAYGGKRWPGSWA